MKIYVEVNGKRYPAIITGRLSDHDWDNRESKAITCEMTYEEAISTFVEDVSWNIVEEHEDTEEYVNEKGEKTLVPTMRTEIYNNSDYSMAGDVVDHRNGTVTIKMGKPTAEEILAILEGVL